MLCDVGRLTSRPSRSWTGWMTLGNWFSPESPLQVLDAAVMSLNTISLAIAWERRVSKGIKYFNQIEGSAFAEYQRLSIWLSWSVFQKFGASICL